MPVVTIPRLLLTLLSLLILAAAAYLLRDWWLGRDLHLADGLVRHVRGARWELLTGAGLLAWSFLGRFVILRAFPAGGGDLGEERGEARTVHAPDGSALNVESFGPAGAPTLVLTHGWGLAATAWIRTRRELGARYRLVVWDLPGLGRSKQPRDGRLTIDRFAEALAAVVASTGAQRVVLVGHSIGGMTTQTLWRVAPPELKARIAGMALVDTTHENPLMTMWLSPLWRLLRWPVIEPLSWLTIALSPLVWLANWQGYLSGTAHLAMRWTGFGRRATRGEVDFTARLAAKGSPAVQAKGNLAMFRWRATEVLAAIDKPVLALCGTRDIITLPAASQTIARLAPHGRVTAVPGAGHMGFLENAAAYSAAIAAFAEEAFSGSRTPTPPELAPELAPGLAPEVAPASI